MRKTLMLWLTCLCCANTALAQDRVIGLLSLPEVFGTAACTAANEGPPQVISEGWLPLHDQKGEPTVWFSSRGC